MCRPGRLACAVWGTKAGGDPGWREQALAERDTGGAEVCGHSARIHMPSFPHALKRHCRPGCEKWPECPVSRRLRKVQRPNRWPQLSCG